MNDITKRDMPNTLARVKNWEGWFWIKFFTFAILLASSICYTILKIDAIVNPYGEYKMTYRVYYDVNNIKEYTVTHNRPIHIISDRGTNMVKKYKGEKVIETSAPIEQVKYTYKTK